MASVHRSGKVAEPAGIHGGEVVFAGPYSDIYHEATESLTTKYMSGRMQIPVPEQRRPVSNFLRVRGARQHNLKNIDVDIRLQHTGRFATPTNAPGASVVSSIVVLPDTWTLITFDLREGSSDIISLGGGTYQAIFSNIGNMQFGFTVPVSLAGQDIDGHFDITDFNIVPGPGALAMLACAGVIGRRRARR